MAIELTLSSGRVVQLRELTAEEQMNADVSAATNGSGGLPQAYYRAVASLAKLDSEVFGPAGSDLDLETRIDLFDASEFNEIVAACVMSFAINEIKKDEAGDWELTSGKKVKVFAKQTARQQMNADRCAGSSVDMPYYRIASIIEAIDGQFTPEVDASKMRVELRRLLSVLSARDYEELKQAYDAGIAPSKNDIKNV